MGQVTIYLDDDTEKKLNSIVKAKGTPKSRWIAELIKEKTLSVWPEKIVELAGTWSDLPTAEEIRNSMGTDSRERL